MVGLWFGYRIVKELYTNGRPNMVTFISKMMELYMMLAVSWHFFVCFLLTNSWDFWTGEQIGTTRNQCLSEGTDEGM